ncbi:MAG: hypothetical protein RR630_05480 [Coprobacillus sp.]
MKKYLTKNTLKIILSSAIFLSPFALTGCSKQEKEQPSGKTNTEVEPKTKELTVLEKEIKELKDFQVVDKVYDNKDLEPFNKMQGYLYSINETPGRDNVEVIELLPPTKEGLKVLEKSGENYRFINNVIIPCYFEYTDENTWVKRYPSNMNQTIKTYWFRADSKYLYSSDEELNKFFGTKGDDHVFKID